MRIIQIDVHSAGPAGTTNLTILQAPSSTSVRITVPNFAYCARLSMPSILSLQYGVCIRQGVHSAQKPYSEIQYDRPFNSRFRA